MFVAGRLQNLLTGHHHAQIDDLVVVAAQHDADDVLADVVDVTLDGGHDDGAARGRFGGFAADACGLLLLLHKRHKVSHGLLHHAGALHDLRQEHLAVAEEIAHDLDAGHERAFDDFQAGGVLLPGFFHVDVDIVDDALNERVLEPLLDGAVSPGRIGLVFLCGLSLKSRAVGDEPLGGVRAAVENHVLDPLAQGRLDVFIDGQLPGVDDAHIEPGVDGVVEKCRVERLADRVVAAKRKRDIAHAAGNLHVRQQFLDLPRGLDEVYAVLCMFLHARADGQNVRIEDDVGRLDARLFGEQFIGALGDADFVLDGDGLTLLVEHHHHAGRAVLLHEASVVEELGLALLEADGIDNRLALHAFQPRFQHRPTGTVDHHGHAGDVRLRGDEIEELGHHFGAVQQSLVHIDVDDVRAALYLLPGDGNRLAQVAVADQPGEPFRAGDVRPFADHREGAFGEDHERLESAVDRIVARRRRPARRFALHGIGNGADVVGRASTAAADDIHPAVGGELAQRGGHLRRRLVVAAELVRQSGVGVAACVARATLRKFLDVWPHERGAERAVDADADEVRVFDRGEEGGQRLPGECPPAEVGDRDRDHHRELDLPFSEEVIDGEQARFEIERIENRFGQQDIDAAIDQSLGLLVVGSSESIKGHCPVAWVVHIRRERRGAIGWADRTGDEGTRAAPLYLWERGWG